jgi:hypothetical protein
MSLRSRGWPVFEKSLTGGVHALGQRLRELVRDDEIASVVFLGKIVELRLETTYSPFHHAQRFVTVELLKSALEDVLATTWMEMTTDFHKMRDEYGG